VHPAARPPTPFSNRLIPCTFTPALTSTASLKKILGHDRLETTEIYLNICPEDALGEFFQKVDGARRRQWD
jgi:hypothetical protein